MGSQVRNKKPFLLYPVSYALCPIFHVLYYELQIPYTFIARPLCWMW